MSDRDFEAEANAEVEPSPGFESGRDEAVRVLALFKSLEGSTVTSTCHNFGTEVAFTKPDGSVVSVTLDDPYTVWE